MNAWTPVRPAFRVAVGRSSLPAQQSATRRPVLGGAVGQYLDGADPTGGAAQHRGVVVGARGWRRLVGVNLTHAPCSSAHRHNGRLGGEGILLPHPGRGGLSL